MLRDYASHRIGMLRRFALAQLREHEPELETETAKGTQHMYDPNQYNQAMDKFNNTRPVGPARDPYIPDGNHELIVLSIEPFRNAEQNDCIRARFVVEKSNVIPPGAIVSQAWNLDKAAPKPGMTTDRDRFVDFICKLQGINHGEHHAACRAVARSRAEGGNCEAQPARGARIAATGVPKITKTGANAGKPYTVVDWRTTQQDGQRIAQTRAQLDANPTYALQAQQPQAPAPQQGYAQPAPAQPQWGAPAQPVPQQAPAQPQWGAPAPQPAPQGPPGGWGQTGGGGGLPF